MTGRRRAERGSVPIELALGVGLLVLPTAVLALAFPPWIERLSMARVAAAEAARAAVLADSAAAAEAAAEQVVAVVAANHGVDAGDVGLCLSPAGHTDPHRCPGLAALNRGAAVTAHVTVALPALDLPGLARLDAGVRTVSHTEHVDRYRTFPR